MQAVLCMASGSEHLSWCRSGTGVYILARKVRPGRLRLAPSPQDVYQTWSSVLEEPAEQRGWTD